LTSLNQEEILKLGKKPVNKDAELIELKNYFYGDQFNLSVVQAAITTICTQLPRIRPVTSWHIPSGENNYHFDVYKMVFEKIQEPGYLEYIWPMLKTIMGDCIGNILWAADLVILFTLLVVLSTLSDATAALAILHSEGEK